MGPASSSSGDPVLEALSEIASNPECVAVGECGLDFNRNFSPKDVQLEVFEKQIELACRIRKPLFLHERDAHEDMVRLLEKYQGRLPNCVIHCFTGTKEQALKYISMGCYIGLTGDWTGLEIVYPASWHFEAAFELRVLNRQDFAGAQDEAMLAIAGYLWKDKSEDGVRKILQDNAIPLDRLMVETDAPFMYPNTRASKLPQHIKDALTEK